MPEENFTPQNFSYTQLFAAANAVSFSYMSTPTTAQKADYIPSISGNSSANLDKLAIAFYKKGAIPGKNLPAGYVFHRGNEILVSYRGTENYNVSEIVNDISIRPASMGLANGENIHLHAGFKNEYDQSKESMKEALAQIMGDETLPITFTGHSMGAAVAQIAALEKKSEDLNARIKVITFGGPRVFTNNTADLYDIYLKDETLRIKNSKDSIPDLPPKGIYKHAGNHITISTRDNITVTHIMPAYIDILRILEEEYPNGISTESIQDNSAKRLNNRDIKAQLQKDIMLERVERVKKTYKAAINGSFNEAKTSLFNTEKRKKLIESKNAIRL